MARAADCVNHLARLAGISQERKASFDWLAVEEMLGLGLPEDYKLLAELLPDGWFRGFVRVLLPGETGAGGARFLDSDAVNRLEDMRRWRAEGYGTFPYPIYPEAGGLVPWGSGVRGGLFFWLTGPGDPDEWPVVASSAEWDYWDRFDGTMCEFLVEVAAARYDASGFADGPLTEVVDAGGAFQVTGRPVNLAARGPVFRPVAGRRPAGEPAAQRPDFWVRRLRELGPSRRPIDEFPALQASIGRGPAGLPKVDWADVHARLGCELPADYRAFADAYGPGRFGDLLIAAPGAAGEADLFALLERKAAQVRGLPRHEWDAPIYPEPGGMISWGETIGGYTCGWAPTSTDPSEWSVVAIAPGAALNSYTFAPGLSFSTLLKEHKEHAEQHPGLDLGIIPPRDPSAGPVRFIPAGGDAHG